VGNWPRLVLSMLVGGAIGTAAGVGLALGWIRLVGSSPGAALAFVFVGVILGAGGALAGAAWDER
jgi:hypothetical protein